MSMSNPEEPDGNTGRIRLKWAGAYFISHDGFLSSADGTPRRGMSLMQARDYAGGEVLVFSQNGVPMAQTIRFASAGEAANPDADAMPYHRSALAMKATGDISRGWYFVNADDGARWLMHGATYARHLSAPLVD